MKNLFLITLFALFTIVATAQEKPKPNTGTNNKANHNTSRSNKRAGGIAKPDTNTGEASISGKRKCIKSGGTFYEYPNGNTRCFPARAIKDKSQNLPSEEMEGGISKRKECLKTGGVWATNSHGTFCYRKLKD